MDERGAVRLRPGETVQGYIPAVDLSGPNFEKREDKLIHWKEAVQTPGRKMAPGEAVQGTGEPVPQHVFEAMKSGLPAPVRRTARQRYDVLVKRLLEIGRQNTVNGQVYWPQSMQRILDLQGVKSSADVHQQVYALARHFIVKAENQQRASDMKKSVLDWHGSFA